MSDETHARDEVPSEETVPEETPQESPARHARPAGEPAPAHKHRGGLIGLLRETGIVLGTALILSLLIKTFLAQAFYIPSESMEPTLLTGDRVMVSLLTPGPFDIKRGDVVVFKDPGGWLNNVQKPQRGPVNQAMVDALTFVGVLPHDSGEHLIKRVIGLPGDHVVCCDAQSRITINGTAIDETGYIAPGAQPSQDPFDVVVPANRLWVMGDNRANSDDSHLHWVNNGHNVSAATVPESNVVGRAVFVFYPWSNKSWLGDFPDVYQTVPAPSAK